MNNILIAFFTTLFLSNCESPQEIDTNYLYPHIANSEWFFSNPVACEEGFNWIKVEVQPDPIHNYTRIEIECGKIMKND